MPQLDFHPFVGALWVDEALVGTSCVCSLARALVSCFHCLPDRPESLAWQPLGSEESIPLKDWEIVYGNEDLDIVVVLNGSPLIPVKDVPDLPRDPQTHGIDVHFHAIVKTEEEGVAQYGPDTGDGKVLGPRQAPGAPTQYRMSSPYVTPGSSGAPILYESGVGQTVIGMISGRYNSDSNWNRDSVWLVTGENLRAALRRAQARIIAESVLFGAPLVSLDLDEFAADVDAARLPGTSRDRSQAVRKGPADA